MHNWGDLAQKIIELTGKEVEIIGDTQRIRPEKSEVERLLSNAEKAKKVTGWEPKYTLEEGLKETIDWIKDNLHHYKPEIYNV